MTRKYLILLLSLATIYSVFANTQTSRALDNNDPLSIKPLLKELLTQNQQTLNRLVSEVQALKKSRQQNLPTTPKKIEQMPSPMDREAMNSPIFLPGGAPMPEGYNNQYKNQQQTSQTSTEESKSKAEDESAQAKNQNSDNNSSSSSSYNNPYSNYNNSSSGYYPSNTTTNPLLQFSPQQEKYTYTIANTNNNSTNMHIDEPTKIVFRNEPNTTLLPTYSCSMIHIFQNGRVFVVWVMQVASIHVMFDARQNPHTHTFRFLYMLLFDHAFYSRIPQVNNGYHDDL